MIITIGALCWFKELDRFFAVVAKCMKPGGVIVINEQHPCTNMLATDGEDLCDPEHRMECLYSYFEHEWTGNEVMYYMTQKRYESKTFTDFSHPMTDIAEPHFVIELYPVTLKWTMDTDRDQKGKIL